MSHDQGRNIKEAETGCVRPRWIPMCVLQAYRLTDVRSSVSKVALLGTRYGGKTARLKELGDSLPLMQFITPGQLRAALLSPDRSPNWGELARDLAASLERKETSHR